MLQAFVNWNIPLTFHLVRISAIALLQLLLFVLLVSTRALPRFCLLAWTVTSFAWLLGDRDAVREYTRASAGLSFVTILCVACSSVCVDRLQALLKGHQRVLPLLIGRDRHLSQ